MPQEQLHPGYKALTARLNGEPGAKRGYQLSTANALWGQKGYGFLPEFVKLTRDHYGAGLTEVDYGKPRLDLVDRVGRELAAMKALPGGADVRRVAAELEAFWPRSHEPCR